MSKTGAEKKKQKKLVDFELSPPRCANCTHYNPPEFGVPNKRFYKLPSCKTHGFEVKPHSICDTWISKAGEQLESQ